MEQHVVDVRTITDYSITKYQLTKVVNCDRCGAEITVVYFVVPQRYATSLESICHTCFEAEYVFLTLEGKK